MGGRHVPSAMFAASLIYAVIDAVTTPWRQSNCHITSTAITASRRFHPVTASIKSNQIYLVAQN